MDGYRPITGELLEGLLSLAARTPPYALVQVLPLPTQALFDQLLLLFPVGAEIFNQRLGLLGGAFPHLADLPLQVRPAGVHFFAEEALLNIIPHEQPFDLILVELAASCEGLLVVVVGLRGGCEFERKEGDGFLGRWGGTT
jgi:hypothetical protein